MPPRHPCSPLPATTQQAVSRRLLSLSVRNRVDNILLWLTLFVATGAEVLCSVVRTVSVCKLARYSLVKALDMKSKRTSDAAVDLSRQVSFPVA